MATREQLAARAERTAQAEARWRDEVLPALRVELADSLAAIHAVYPPTNQELMP